MLALAAAGPGQGRNRLARRGHRDLCDHRDQASWDQIYTVTPGYQIGIYQKPSTRNQGEIISSDSY